MSDQPDPNHHEPPLSPEQRAQAALQAGLDMATITDVQVTRRDEEGNVIERAELVPSVVATDDVPAGGTAHEKIMHTLRALSEVEEDAGELELMLASLAIALERGLGDQLAGAQADGQLDDFMAALVRWIATLTSDNRPRLIVVPIPRRPLTPQQKLYALMPAEQEYDQAASPLS